MEQQKQHELFKKYFWMIIVDSKDKQQKMITIWANKNIFLKGYIY